jgi:DNA-directed RNA polymerase subunit RPC12/RpoP
MSIEALKQALEALRKARRKILTPEECHAAITFLHQAIAEAEKQQHGSPEDMYVEMHKHLNCPHCGGSGHIDDVAEKQEPLAFIAPNGDLRKTAEAQDVSEWGEKFQPLYTSPYAAAAIKTLEFLKYTYHGGEQWKPPLGEKPPEPVGEAYLCDSCSTPFDGAYECPSCGHNAAIKEPVYTSPPQRQWVGLTKAERKEIAVRWRYSDEVIAEIEAKLKEKNT